MRSTHPSTPAAAHVELGMSAHLPWAGVACETGPVRFYDEAARLGTSP